MLKNWLIIPIYLAAAGIAAGADGSRRPQPADFAPDRFRFAPLELDQVGREIPFVYDAVGAAAQAKRETRTTYDTWIGLGLQLLRERDYNVAADCFRTALAMTNASPDAVRHLLARSLLLDDRPLEAEKVWEDLCRRNPQDAEARWQLAFSLFLRDDPDGALDHVQALETLAPAHPYPPLMTGLLHWSLGQFQDAARWIITSTRRNKAPDLAFLAMAALASRNGDFPEAVGWMRRGFDRMPPAEQRRWYVRPPFDTLRHSGHALVADLEREFALNDEAPAAIAEQKSIQRGFDVANDRPFGASLDFAPLRDAPEDTNAVPDPEGLRVLRLAPRIIPK